MRQRRVRRRRYSERRRGRRPSHRARPLGRSAAFMKKPWPQIIFGDIPQGLPKNCAQRSRRELLVYGKGQGLSFSRGQDSHQLGVAASHGCNSESETIERAQDLPRAHLAQSH